MEKKTEIIQAFIELKKFWFQHMGRHMEDQAATILQYEAMSYIYKHPGCAMKELSLHMDISISSATQLTNRLMQSYLLARVQDEKDRRVIHLNLTKTGEKELKEKGKRMEEKIQLIIDAIPQKDLEDFLRIQKDIVSVIYHKK